MRPAHRSLMMSPYRLGITSTSNCAGLLTCAEVAGRITSAGVHHCSQTTRMHNRLMLIMTSNVYAPSYTPQNYTLSN